MKDLGVVMDFPHLPVNELRFIKDRFQSRLEGWKLSTLSFSGRLVLLKSVLTHCPLTCLVIHGFLIDWLMI